MTQFEIYSVASVSLFGLGLFGLIALPNILRKILSFNVLGVGIFLFLVATAQRDDPTQPDPVPQAMVLTGIVVAVSVTAFALALLQRLHGETGMTMLDDEKAESDQ